MSVIRWRWILRLGGSGPTRHAQRGIPCGRHHPVDAADRDLAPVYPGISDSLSLRDWDPPFPLDSPRIRPLTKRTGTSIGRRRRHLSRWSGPATLALSLWGGYLSARGAAAGRVAARDAQPARRALRRHHRSADHGDRHSRRARPGARGLSRRHRCCAYFVYFSFFLVVSALLLVSLFFKLGIEQRVREVGLLRAVGFGPVAVRRVFTAEGLVLALAAARSACSARLAMPRF
jgi:hypothetical protein